MDDTVENVEVIESEKSGDDNDDDLTMESVPFKEKVEKWLVACNGAHANRELKDSETFFQKKTVVVREIIDETESLHSVDTEQYIKSNRRKTTTKITTTTIKKYYSIAGGGGFLAVQEPLLTVRDETTNEGEKDSCNGNGPEKPSGKSSSLSQGKKSQTNRKRRCHQNRKPECDIHHVGNICPPVPFSRTKIARTYNTRRNDEKQNKNQISAGTSDAFNSKTKPKQRAKVTKKRNQLATKGSHVKLKPSNGCADSVSVEAAKPINSKLKTGSLRSDVNFKRTAYDMSSDSEQDDILLTSYKPFSLLNGK